MTEPIEDQADLETEAVLERTGDGWSIRLPVRSEAIHVRKQVVVRERVLIHRVTRPDVERIDTSVRRERLRVDAPTYDALSASARADIEQDREAGVDADPDVSTDAERPVRGQRQARRTNRRR